MPEIIIKPKPEPWGTCLCMACINTELKVSDVNKTIPECEIGKLDEVELQCLCNEVTKSKQTIQYLKCHQHDLPEQKDCMFRD